MFCISTHDIGRGDAGAAATRPVACALTAAGARARQVAASERVAAQREESRGVYIGGSPVMGEARDEVESGTVCRT